MRRIAIVGAGQSGLHLGIGLVDAGYDVTVLSNRRGEDIAAGRVMSSQCMFHPTLELERKHGLELWEDQTPPVHGIDYTWSAPDGTVHAQFATQREKAALSIDQRVKIPRWMEIFTERGGTLQIEDVDADRLDELSETFDLVVVAAGKGDIARKFATNEEHTEYTTPQRALSLAYLTGVTPREGFGANDYNVVDGVGEMFLFPALTVDGPCEIVTAEGIIDGPLDRFAGVMDPDEHLATLKAVAREYFPGVWERIKDAELIDRQAYLAGKFAPTVREPVAVLPSGRAVLGMADVVVVNDPLTGQGSNNAARCAESYLQSIIERGTEPFTPEWMNEAFAAYWEFAQYATTWTNDMLRPYPPHVRRLLEAATSSPEIALRITNGFGNPPSLFPWWNDPAAADELIASVSASTGAPEA